MILILSFLFPFLKDGATPLFISSQEGNVEVVKELIKGKANIDARTMVRGVFVFVLPKPQYLYKLPFVFVLTHKIYFYSFFFSGWSNSPLYFF